MAVARKSGGRTAEGRTRPATIGKQVAKVLFRDLSLNPCFVTVAFSPKHQRVTRRSCPGTRQRLKHGAERDCLRRSRLRLGDRSSHGLCPPAQTSRSQLWQADYDEDIELGDPGVGRSPVQSHCAAPAERLNA